MNKAQLIDAVSEDTGLAKTDVTRVIESLVDSITHSLKRGDKVTLVGFGTFSTSKRAAREGRNPRTGETIHIAASKAAKFAPGKELKTALNG